MDRNNNGILYVVTTKVALRKESVDRNSRNAQGIFLFGLSLSARRAWIEIPAGCWRDARRASLSARRAWIEIPWVLQS